MHRIQQKLKGADTMQTNFQQVPVTIIRLTDVMIRTGLPKSSVYEKIKNKEITPPIAIGARRVAWPAYEIDEINRALIAGLDSQAIKTLVAKLTEQRKTIAGAC
ncbi:MAG: prophage regulatory protein [Psychrobacter glaciei]